MLLNKLDLTCVAFIYYNTIAVCVIVVVGPPQLNYHLKPKCFSKSVNCTFCLSLAASRVVLVHEVGIKRCLVTIVLHIKHDHFKSILAIACSESKHNLCRCLHRYRRKCGHTAPVRQSCAGVQSQVHLSTANWIDCLSANRH